MSGSATAERRSVRAQSEGVEVLGEETAPEQPAPEGIPVPDAEPAGEPAPQPASPARPAPQPMPDPVSITPGGELVRWDQPSQSWVQLRESLPASGSVWAAISRVQGRVGAIPKTGTSDQGYRFRGIDQVYEALHGICAEEGLVILPQATPELRPEVRQTKSGGSLYAVRCLVGFLLVGPDGSQLQAAAWGEGSDSSDKSTQKAHSQAVKSALLSLFLIPTEESAEQEPDAANPEGRPFSEQEVERGYTALQAAKDAQTVEALAAVRRRALSGGLLPVPLQEENGTVAALTYWIDQRRTVLEQATPQGGES